MEMSPAEGEVWVLQIRSDQKNDSASVGVHVDTRTRWRVLLSAQIEEAAEEKWYKKLQPWGFGTERNSNAHHCSLSGNHGNCIKQSDWGSDSLSGGTTRMARPLGGSKVLLHRKLFLSRRRSLRGEWRHADMMYHSKYKTDTEYR